MGKRKSGQLLCGALLKILRKLPVDTPIMISDQNNNGDSKVLRAVKMFDNKQACTALHLVADFVWTGGPDDEEEGVQGSNDIDLTGKPYGYDEEDLSEEDEIRLQAALARAGMCGIPEGMTVEQAIRIAMNHEKAMAAAVDATYEEVDCINHEQFACLAIA